MPTGPPPFKDHLMQALLAKAARSFMDSCGVPRTFEHHIKTHHWPHVELAPKGVSLATEDIHNWQDWTPDHEDGLIGWRWADDEYDSFRHQIPALLRLCDFDTNGTWQGDIRDVDAVCASKSNLALYPTLDAFALARCSGLIAPATPETLQMNLDWPEVRIVKSSTSDHFITWGWDGRIFLSNNGGSHHFAAARYLASTLKTPIPLKGRLVTYRLNCEAVAALADQYDVYAFGNDATWEIAFRDHMKRFSATYLRMHLPRLYRGWAAFLPKSCARASAVSAVLRRAGVPSVSEHLVELARSQRLPPAPAA